jgi:hypothetical protein
VTYPKQYLGLTSLLEIKLVNPLVRHRVPDTWDRPRVVTVAFISL